MKIAIIYYPEAILSSITGPFDIFSKSYDIATAFGMNEHMVRFEVEVVSFQKILENSYLPIIEPVENMQYDLIIVPAMNFDKVQDVLHTSKPLINWIKTQYCKGAEVASICLGAFILAETGLLNKKKATTHWMGANLFRNLYPQIKLLDDKIIVDNNGIYTSGGAFSFTSLVVYLLEKYCGHSLAMLLSKVFMIHLHNSSQHSFSIFNLQLNHNDNQILKTQQYIEDHFAKSIKQEELQQMAHMTGRTFQRRFKAATGNTPYEYIQRVRTEAAKKMLEQSSETVEGIALNVGYVDFSSFRKVFKKFTGTTPREYKNRYGKTFKPEFVENSEMKPIIT